MKSHSQSRNSRRHPASLPQMHDVLGAVHRSLIASHTQPFPYHSSLDIRHRPNQPLAKHNRKPVQLIENKQRRLKSIASFCGVFLDYATLFQARETATASHDRPLTNH